jgi:hypothetical protein
MGQDKYLISYDWRNPMGTYVFCENWSTNSLVKFICKFVYLSFKYEVIDVQYRNFKD